MTAKPKSLTRLDFVAHLEMGQSPPSNVVSDVPEAGMPFLQGNAEFTDAHPEPRLWCSRPQKTCEAADVLISVRAPVGSINVADRAYCIGRGLAAVRFTRVQPEYGAFALKHYAPSLQRVAQGTTFDAVGRRELGALKIWFPSLAEQRCIAEVLDTLDEAIRNAEQLIAKLKQVKQGLLHDLLTCGIDENGELRDPERHPEQFKKSPLGWIPREWDVAVAGQLCQSIVPGRNKPTLDGGALPWITVGDLDAPYVFESKLGLSLSLDAVRTAGGRTVPARAVVMSCVGEFGKVAVAAREIVINQQLHGFICSDRLLPEWLALCLVMQGRYMGKIATQTTIKYLNKAGCEAVPVAVPSVGEQQRVVDGLARLDARINEECRSVSKLLSVKRGLSDDLLLGRVRVTPLLTEFTP
jgi:type I restriction enzyme S subunit